MLQRTVIDYERETNRANVFVEQTVAFVFRSRVAAASYVARVVTTFDNLSSATTVEVFYHITI